MELWELILLAVALSMDAFAVSICKGLVVKDKYLKAGLICGIWFGFFQALMPLFGWILGFLALKIESVKVFVQSFSSIIAFILLAFLGFKMIKEAIKEIKEDRLIALGKEEKENENKKDSSLAFDVMIVFAIATSIDALAAGLTFTAMGFKANPIAIKDNLWLALILIGITTFIFSFVGSIIGAKVGSKFTNKAEIAGGLILFCIGLKILIEYMISLF